MFKTHKLRREKAHEQRRMEALEKLRELCKPESGTGKAVSAWKFVQK